jgi:aminopeptidase
MLEADLARYAAILVDTCLGFEAGDRLRISGEIPHRPLMLAAARRAYELGARAVRVEFSDPTLRRIQADFQRDEYLGETSLAQTRLSETYASELWSVLSILGEEDPSASEGADPGKLQKIGRARYLADKSLQEAVRTNRIAWCVAPFPTAAWAREAIPHIDEGRDPAEALWAVLTPILRIDSSDPAAAVRAHMEGLEAKARALDELCLRELRFTGPGTDLRVPLSPSSRWIGGGSDTPAGRHFYANIPTEELFTSPDWRGVEGKVACTRPFEIYGKKVRGARLEFRSGELVGLSADENEETLARFADTDPGAKRLGEIALVDCSGPIFRSGLVFGNGLIDENAACHLALGSAYTEAWEGSVSLPEEERSALGFNVSLVHEDIMIGSEEVEVTAMDASGREVSVIEGGRFRV